MVYQKFHLLSVLESRSLGKYTIDQVHSTPGSLDFEIMARIASPVHTCTYAWLGTQLLRYLQIPLAGAFPNIFLSTIKDGMDALSMAGPWGYERVDFMQYLRILAGQPVSIPRHHVYRITILTDLRLGLQQRGGMGFVAYIVLHLTACRTAENPHPEEH